MSDRGPASDLSGRLLRLGGGDPFVDVRRASEDHQATHGCGLHNAGAPQMQLVASLARAGGVRRAVDLGCGLGYSTLWIAHAVGPDGSVVGIDDDADHIAEARKLADTHGLADRVSYVTGRVEDVLGGLDGPVDMIHDDAWFAKQPDHLDAAIGLLRPGGLYTMVNWFLLVDAITADQRNDWASYAGPSWADDTVAYAEHLAQRADLDTTWVTTPPVAFATKR